LVHLLWLRLLLRAARAWLATRRLALSLPAGLPEFTDGLAPILLALSSPERETGFAERA